MKRGETIRAGKRMIPWAGARLQGREAGGGRALPERTGYRPVMKSHPAVGVQRGDAARCCVSFAPSVGGR